MSDKVEITDEMVERAYAAYGPAAAHVSPNDSSSAHKGRMKCALDFAMNGAPADPTIVVTEEMKFAGQQVAIEWVRDNGRTGTSELWVMAGKIYEAMHAKAPIPEISNNVAYKILEKYCLLTGEQIPGVCDRRVTGMMNALAEYLPILSGRKKVEGVDAAYAAGWKIEPVYTTEYLRFSWGG